MTYQHYEITNHSDTKDLILLEELIIIYLTRRGFSSYWTKESMDEFGKHFYTFFEIDGQIKKNNSDLFKFNLSYDYYTFYDDHRGRPEYVYDYAKIFKTLNSIVLSSRRTNKINQLLQPVLFG